MTYLQVIETLQTAYQTLGRSPTSTDLADESNEIRRFFRARNWSAILTLAGLPPVAETSFSDRRCGTCNKPVYRRGEDEPCPDCGNPIHDFCWADHHCEGGDNAS